MGTRSLKIIAYRWDGQALTAEEYNLFAKKIEEIASDSDGYIVSQQVEKLATEDVGFRYRVVESTSPISVEDARMEENMSLFRIVLDDEPVEEVDYK